jgi:hypothetical protein
VLAKVFLAALAAVVLAVPAQAQVGRQLLMPGVTYEREVQFTSHGPVAVHVVTAPKPNGMWSLKPVPARGTILGRDTVTAMQRTLMRDATVVGVNGDYAAADGRPLGLMLRGGVLEHPPLADRSSVAIGADGLLRVGRVQLFGRWNGNGQRRPLDVNEPPPPNGVSLFTPAWGPTTPSVAGAVETVLAPFPAATPNVEHQATVGEIVQSNGGTAIPPNGVVLMARGTGAQRLAAEAPAGTQMTIRLLLSPDWSAYPDGLGGGPVLVRDGKPVFRHGEQFTASILGRNARSAVGQLRDGRILLVTVDGGQRGYSTGMTNFELAQTLVRLGAVTASGLEAGPAATMAFEGELLNRPSTGGREVAVGQGLFVFYRGVHAPPPTESVVSPNGDNVADVQGFSYKLTRRSTVSATLVGPDRQTREIDSGEKVAGVQRLTWRGVTADGRPEPEGAWRFVVTATDDLGQRSTAERPFALNRTLGSLAVQPVARSVRAGFTLTRQANVSGRIETPNGAVIAVLGPRALAAGARSVTWNGSANGKRAAAGRYVFRVTAANAVGRVELAQAFSLPR